MTWRGSYYTEVMLDCFLPEFWPFVSFSHLSKVLASTTPHTFLKVYWWNFPVIVSMTRKWTCFIEVMLNRFLPKLWHFVSFSHLSTEVLVSATPPTFLNGYWWNFPVIVSMNWKWSYFIEVMLYWFLPELWFFGNFLTVSLVSATPLAVCSGF